MSTKHSFGIERIFAMLIAASILGLVLIVTHG